VLLPLRGQIHAIFEFERMEPLCTTLP
jgi:hypothetical protein